MTPRPQPSQRAYAILEAALKRRQSERVAFIEGACGENHALHQEVIQLLDSVEAPQVEPAVAEPQSNEHVAIADRQSTDGEAPTRIAPRVEPVAPSPGWRPGQPMEGRIGPYQLLHSLGKGGMGSVYAASRADQEYKKIVAIKLVTSGLDSEEMLRRFRNERQVLAGLDHPYIARLLDGGSTDDGFPYLVMEFVEGLPIDRYCEANHLSLTERLKLFQKVCSAVQYAHQNLVVHRDIKPGNILVGTNGEPKLLDFGIAKLMTAAFSVEEIELNRGESQPMTLRYASPEQVRGEPITTESDIYSLGVVLYELLAGEHPFQASLTSRAAIERAILTEEPAKPSDLLKRRAGREADAKLKHSMLKLARQLTADLDPVLLTALAKQPRGRFPSAESFSLDLTRYLNGFPVSPRRDEVGYRAHKFIRRHRISLIAAAFVALALVAGSIVTWQSAQTARAERAKAQSRFDDVRKLARFVLFDFDDKIKAGPTEARKVLVTEALKYLDGLARNASGDASLGRELIEGYLKVGDLQGNPNGPNSGDAAAAQESYTKALQLADALRAKYPQDTRLQEAIAQANMKVGDLSEYSGNKAVALQRYRQALAIVQPLAAVDDQAKRGVMVASGKIGAIQLQLGDTSGALENYGRYLPIAQELLAAHPNDPNTRRDAALGYDQMGETMAKTGAVSEGLEKLKMARSIYRELAQSSPQSPARRDVATVDMVIGDILFKTAGKSDEAVVSFQQALKITETLVAEDPKNTEYKRDLHITLGRLADALYAAGKKPEARHATERALQVLRPMVDAPGADGYEIYQYCWLLLTTQFPDLRAPNLARHYAEQLVQSTAGKDPGTLDLLARAYDGAGDSSRAAETETKALALLPANSASDLRTELQENLTKFRSKTVGKQPH